MNNLNLYRPIAPINMFIQLAVPTVYEDSLSYLEGVSKLNFKVNELIQSQNGIPALITEMIDKRFDSSGIRAEINQILAENVIDAKNPPDNLNPVTGDGQTNDTTNLQAIINYASNLAAESTPKMVSLPAGTYILDTIELKESVSLIGQTCFTTVLKAADFANVPLIRGDLANAVLGNISFDANSANNSVYPNVLDLTTSTGESHIQNVRVINCGTRQLALNYSNAGYLLIDNFTALGGGMVISGTGIASLHIIYLDSSYTGLTINSDRTTLKAGIFKNCTTAITLAGHNIDAAFRTFGGGLVVNPQPDNIISAPTLMLKNYVETLDFTADTSNISMGNATITAAKIDLDVAGDVTAEIGERDIIINGEDSLSAASKMTTVANLTEIDTGDYNMRVHGNANVSLKNVTATANVFNSSMGIVSASAQMYTRHANEEIITNQRYERHVNDDIEISAKNLKLDVTNPIIYQAARKLDDNFNYITMLTPNGESIQVLVYNGKPLDPGGGTTPTPTVSSIYINVKDKGAVGDGITDDTEAFIAAGESNGFIFVPYGTYLVDTFTVTSSCKGIIGEMSTITSNATTGNMITSGGGWLSISNIILAAPDAETVISVPDGAILDKVFINGHVAGQIIMSNCRINNSSNVALEGFGRLVNNIINGNIVLQPQIVYQITGNQIHGSFVLSEVTEANKVFGLTITGNFFQSPVTVPSSLITNLRCDGNINLADYPEIVIPDPTPAWDYNVPADQAVNFLPGWRQVVTDGDILIQHQNTDGSWETIIDAAPAHTSINNDLWTIKQVFSANSPLQFVPAFGDSTGVQMVGTSNSLQVQSATTANTWSTILEIFANLLNILTETQINNLIPLSFKGVNGNALFRITTDANNNFLLQVLSNDNWTNVLQLHDNGRMDINSHLTLQDGNSIRFRDSTGNERYQITTSTDNSLILYTAVGSSWVPVFTITNTGAIINHQVFAMRPQLGFIFQNNSLSQQYRFYLDDTNNLLLQTRIGNSWTTALSLSPTGSLSAPTLSGVKRLGRYLMLIGDTTIDPTEQGIVTINLNDIDNFLLIAQDDIALSWSGNSIAFTGSLNTPSQRTWRVSVSAAQVCMVSKAQLARVATNNTIYVYAGGSSSEGYWIFYSL